MSRHFLAPEVIQTSTMDCGPAALKCLCEGFDIPVSYGHLRELCQTSLDGTSIDTLEEVAIQLGLEAEQVVVPIDHVLLPAGGYFPALAVIRLPNGNTHFVVIWRQHGQIIQYMDPGSGRHWQSETAFKQQLYLHQMPVLAAEWREWAGSDEFITPLRARLHWLKIAEVETHLETAQQDPDWYGLAQLDAVTRMVTEMVKAHGIRKGHEAGAILTQLLQQSTAAIPALYWTVEPNSPEPETGEEQFLLKGAVLVRIKGRQPSLNTEPISAEISAILQPRSPNLWRDTLMIVRQDYTCVQLGLLMGGIWLSGIGRILEILIVSGLLAITQRYLPLEQRQTAVMAVIFGLLAFLLLEVTTHYGLLETGRHLEVRLRQMFFAKLPRLGERYFGSRLGSDMAERSHQVHMLHDLPLLVSEMLRTLTEMLIIMALLSWLYPDGAMLMVLLTFFFIGMAYLTNRVTLDHNLRVATYKAVIANMVLGTLLGLIPARAHQAERVLRRQYEHLLSQYRQGWHGMYNSIILLEGLRTCIGYSLLLWVVYRYLNTNPANGLLFIYWLLSLMALGQFLVENLYSLNRYHSTYLRLLEPIAALEDEPPPALSLPVPQTPTGVAIQLQAVEVKVAGHTILQDLSLEITPGEHVAVIGASGAGKSTLVGLLLGLHRPSQGSICVDGEPLTGAQLTLLRRMTVWIDPAVQLWNQTLPANLIYGQAPPPDLTAILEQANLQGVVRGLPEGLHTPLGEGGGLVSGGEGQRVRFGRGLVHPQPRLVIMDEPFRGLDRPQRSHLMQQARQRWQTATLLCITHDIAETHTFDRVLIVAGGRLVEDGKPDDLLARSASFYQQMWAKEKVIQASLHSPSWRQLWLEKGQLYERLP